MNEGEHDFRADGPGARPPHPPGSPQVTQSTALNEALLISALREHELRENAELLAQECSRLMELAKLATLAAEKANSAKDFFLATLSHELRTPLNPALLVASEGARNSEFHPEARSAFAVIEKSITVEARLIEELLDFTKVAQGKIALRMSILSINDVLRDAVNNVQMDIDAQALRLELQYFAGNPSIRGDAVRLQQVFWNILKNAAKFTPRHGLLRIETAVDPGREMLEIRFIDSGMGIRESDLGRIFDPFNQARVGESLPRSQFGGLGLGLAISKSIVELHSGSIAASSKGPGYGSTFTLELPLGAPLATAPEASSLHKQAEGAKVVPKGTRLLLVEDDADSRLAVQRILRTRGFDVVSAVTFAEAKRLGAEATFDLLLSDIGLPDGNGLELLAAIAHTSPEIKGIALSGYGTSADLLASKAAGYAFHLVKPVAVATLQVALTGALNSPPPFRDRAD